MADSKRSPHAPTSLLATRRAFLMLSTVVRLGLLAVGLGLVLDRTRTLLSDVQLTWGERVVMAIAVVAYGGGFALAGWVADRMLRAAADLIGLMVDQANAAERTANLLEHHVAPALERLAVATERSSTASASAPAPGTAPTAHRPAAGGRELAVAGVRQAIDEQRWDRADRLVKALRRDYPQEPETTALAEEVAEGRQRTVDRLKARLDAARNVGDPDQVIGYRDELTLHLKGEDLKQLDRQVVSWLMSLIQRRLRAGSVRADVAELAARAAESFGDTAEGASLRAALPTLRRSAGLCPRCARPYKGVADACPDCLPSAGRPAARRTTSATATAPDADDSDTEPEGQP